MGLTACLLMAFAASAAPTEIRFESIDLEITRGERASIRIRVELADDAQRRERGLMFRESVDPNGGMLFTSPQARLISVWMKNTRVPLTVAFLRADGTIASFQDLEPLDETIHRAREPVAYMLEMNRGWFLRNGVREGDRVFGLPTPPPPRDDLKGDSRPS